MGYRTSNCQNDHHWPSTRSFVVGGGTAAAAAAAAAAPLTFSWKKQYLAQTLNCRGLGFHNSCWNQLSDMCTVVVVVAAETIVAASLLGGVAVVVLANNKGHHLIVR